MTYQISAEHQEMTISYLYLVAFCPPEKVSELHLSGSGLREAIAAQTGLSEEAFLETALPLVCKQIVSFYQATPEPTEAAVQDLLTVARQAVTSPEAAYALQQALVALAHNPKRAAERNRLRRRSGCQYCQAPCHYGLFSLVSHPNYDLLQTMLTDELAKPSDEQDPINLLWTYTIGHLWRTLGVKEAYIPADSLGNLSYCLLTMVMGKSRLAFPEAEVEKFQQMNQAQIKSWK